MKRWNKEEKLAILKEAEQEGVLPTCRKYGIYPSYERGRADVGRKAKKQG